MSTSAADFDYEATLAACARGERTALGWLYEHEARWLMGVALRIVRRRELADEVLHDAFVQIWQKAASYDPSLGSARGWIYTVVRHRALDALRRSEREGTTFFDTAPDPADDAPGPLDSLVLSNDAKALHRCLQLLDEKKRACILLAYIDGYTQMQIASRLACPLGTVKAWVRRALLALKECLS